MNRNIIAILRGIQPQEAAEICSILVSEGIMRIEVPLNSPNPFETISVMAKTVGETALVGAGTVLSEQDVIRVKDAGGQMVVSPNANIDVIAKSKDVGLLSYPGVMTPTESFTALTAGADGLKLFPSFLVGTAGLKALKAVLPADTETYAVGGVGPANFEDWLQAGITGFGIGTGIYQPGMSAADVKTRAQDIVAAYDAARAK